MSTEVLLQAVASGLLMGCVYALIAVGLSLIFGLMEIVNFAHGEFLMLAMFTTFWLALLFGIDPLVSVPICAALLFVLGVLVYKGIISRILSAPMLAQIFATFGLGVFLRSAAQFFWTADYRVVPHHVVEGRLNLGGLFLGWPQVVASIAALLVFGALYLFVTRTEVGLAIQATSEDREAAALMGISSDRMFMLGWGIGSLCVGIAGALLANFLPIFPDVGFLFALLAYIAVALGGFGSIIGALVAGVIIGLVEAIGGLFLPSFKYVAVFVLYLVVVLVRPQGLFGRY
jgi:branched-chain amino acid transport system permease protein